MRTGNNASQAMRQAEVGLVWEEKLSGATGDIEVEKYSAVRVRAAAGTTVSIDGVLAATMILDEIMIFNAGSGDPNDTKETVTISIAVAGAYVQVARNEPRKR